MKTHTFGKILLIKQPQRHKGFEEYLYKDEHVSVSLFVSPDYVDPKTNKKKKHYHATYTYGNNYVTSIPRGFDGQFKLREGDLGFTPEHNGYFLSAAEAFGVLQENIEYRIRLLERWK